MTLEQATKHLQIMLGRAETNLSIVSAAQLNSKPLLIQALEQDIEALSIILAGRGVEKAPSWQPISSAPKDGTRLLLHPGPNGYSTVGRRSLVNHWWECLPGKYSILPTHWQPLPPAPTGGPA